MLYRTVDFVASCYSTESCKCKLRDIACLKWYVLSIPDSMLYSASYLFISFTDPCVDLPAVSSCRMKCVQAAVLLYSQAFVRPVFSPEAFVSVHRTNIC